ncbi:MAG: tetratricopeptide repeat protein, partial [Planctomycetota bacterium]
AGELLDRYATLLGGGPEVGLEKTLLAVRQGKVNPGDESYLWAMIEQNPNDATVIVEVLVPYYLEHYHFQSAGQALELWLQIDPGAVRPLLLRAQVYEAMGDPQKALADYRQAVKLAPDSEEAELQLAIQLVGHLKAAEAAGHFEHLLQGRPDSAIVLVGLARCRYLTGDARTAQDLLKRALAMHPNSVNALCELGQIALEDGHVEDAERWLQEALRQDPYERDALHLLARCYQKLDKKNLAKEYTARFTKVDADLVRLKKLAREVLDAPRNPDLRYEAGVICLRNGQAQEGLRWLSGALQIDPQHGPTHQALADYYEKAGEPETAARHRQKAAGHQEKTAGPGTRPGKQRLSTRKH